VEMDSDNYEVEIITCGNAQWKLHNVNCKVQMHNANCKVELAKWKCTSEIARANQLGSGYT
jgi:hypothetical protein